ncbi:MAG TPA: hypothetical protein VFG30_19450 [Polyangiales bacterium]|nr:hypothetical protein [Polyangiales bacterium]
MNRQGQLVLGLLLGGCVSSPTFKDQPVIWRVNDRQDMAKPQTNEFERIQYFGEVLVVGPIEHGLGLPDKQPARNVNALDEVPDSTWFTNRLGAHDLTPAEAARGPVTAGPPQLPLTVIRGKDTGGGNPGFFARDATQRTFLIKFDTKQNPEMQTASSVVVNRVLWAVGYFVPEDTLVTFAREQLTLSPDAKTLTPTGVKVKLTETDVDRVLATGPKTTDGRYRASASLLLPGTPVGGFDPEGRRDDDPNDLVDHEDRRELRGLKVLAAWLGHTDMKMDNTLDMYIEENNKHFLRHYLLDFGEALGAHQAEKGRLEDGWENVWDWAEQTKALLTFGLWKRPWEEQTQTPWPSIGAFSSRYFEPDLWKEAYPFSPFAEADKSDQYWGAKQVVRFTRPMIEAIVAEAQLSDPEAAKYLVDALLGRRWKIGRDWLDALTPFDDFKLVGNELCGVDLAVRHGITREGALVQSDDSGRIVDERLVARDGSVCTPLPKAKYAVLRLRIRRGREVRPELQVHYSSEPTPHIIGVIRQPL